jgi:hypothetical protein
LQTTNNKRKAERKPLSFTTTLRNPERIAGFLSCLKVFDGKILTNDLITEIVKYILRKKLYRPTIVNNHYELNTVFDSDDAEFSEKQLVYIIENSTQNHKETGFDRGWSSRFDTWYKICKEFGFAYYEISSPIQISQTGHMLCDAYSNSDENATNKVQSVFLNALIKYQTDNPFRRNANRNVPLLLLMRVIRLLKEDASENGAGISRKELSFILCWSNNDANQLYKYIKDFRAKCGLNASDEIIYRHCLALLGSANETRFKMVQITKEGIDDFLRKIRITGIFSTRGMGAFIDFNALEREKIEYILANYGEYRAFESELEYYNFIGAMDAKIISIETDDVTYDIGNIRKQKLVEIANKYAKEQIIFELELLARKKRSIDLYFSDIDEPTRLEFLTSIALRQTLKDAHIEPNYAIDDEGNPILRLAAALEILRFMTKIMIRYLK